MTGYCLLYPIYYMGAALLTYAVEIKLFPFVQHTIVEEM